MGKSPPETLGILGITDIYLNDNFEPTTPFLDPPLVTSIKRSPFSCPVIENVI
jgi:hypothetical protein